MFGTPLVADTLYMLEHNSSSKTASDHFIVHVMDYKEAGSFFGPYCYRSFYSAKIPFTTNEALFKIKHAEMRNNKLEVTILTWNPASTYPNGESVKWLYDNDIIGDTN
jgi:hypothetical protein